jgi:hypothetical protein
VCLAVDSFKITLMMMVVVQRWRARRKRQGEHERDCSATRSGQDPG